MSGNVPAKVAQEAAITIMAAVLAALVISQLPGLKTWIRKQWADPENPASPWA